MDELTPPGSWMRRLATASVLLLVACGGGGGGDSATDDRGAPDVGGAADAGAACPVPPCQDARVLLLPDFEPGSKDMEPPGDIFLREFEDDCSDLYDQGRFPTFEIEIDDAEWAAIQDEFARPAEREAAGLPPKPYHPLRSFRYGDEYVSDAMIRLKGNQYFSWVPPKMQFVISFREYDKKGRFHGLRKLSLDAPWYDASLLHERVSLAFLREAGVAAGCANNAKLNINGQFYGTYTNKEHLDKEFLERVFGDENADGNLYKYGFELKTNEDTADVSRRDQLWGSPDFAAFSALIDREQVLTTWAGEAMLPAYDNYWCCSHNFYIYDHPTRGFQWIAHDLDISFDGWQDAGPGNVGWDPVYGGGAQHFQWAMAVPDVKRDFVRTMARMLPFYEPDELEERVDRWSEQIRNAMENDPNLPFPYADHPRAVQRLRMFFAQRHEYLTRALEEATACERGEPGRDLDADGFGSCTDCDDLNREIHPGHADPCNTKDDDCNGAIDDGEVCTTCTELNVDGARYAICPDEITWLDAYLVCVRQGGTLAVPQSESERIAVAQQAQMLFAAAPDDGMPKPKLLWLGANDADTEGTWRTVEGVSVPTPPWGPGRPNGDDDQNCAALDLEADGLWNDNDCTEPLPYVCRLP